MSKAVLMLLGARALGQTTPIATFDGAKATTWPWATVNDPVMGGESSSTFKVDQGLGIWDGEVRIVPFLKAPGFCNLQSPGLYKTAAFPDLTGMDGLVVRGRQTNASGLSHFNVQIMTKGAKHWMKQGVYTGDFSMPVDPQNTIQNYVVPWTAFKCTWRGEHITWCPDLKTQLNQVTNIGIGTSFPGKAGPFHMEIAAVFATKMETSLNSGDDTIDLATFDGKAKHSWKTESDPVMGGQSDSKFTVESGYGEYSGTCRIVPKLKAPGFTIALTEAPLVGSFPDVSATSGIVLGLRNAGGNVSDFKFAFCDARINFYKCQFASFKADFSIAKSDAFSEVFLPWSKFSDKWSPYTGEHTSEDPPKAKNLKAITQLQIWTEGVAGTFQLQVKYVRAKKGTQASDTLILV